MIRKNSTNRLLIILLVFCVNVEVDAAENININAGMNDAWFNPTTDGQGFFITVFPDLGVVSLAWFTYDTELPPVDVTANLGGPGHRWLTAIGPIVDKQVTMNIEMTSGGIFEKETGHPRLFMFKNMGVLTFLL